jgi:hypothetical protein
MSFEITNLSKLNKDQCVKYSPNGIFEIEEHYDELIDLKEEFEAELTELSRIEYMPLTVEENQWKIDFEEKLKTVNNKLENNIFFEL